MKIKDLPAIERPQEKLIHYGVDKLADEDLLAIVLSSGIKGLSAIELSKKILKFYNQEELLTFTFKDFKKTTGLGKTKICRIIASIELAKRLIQNKQSRLLLTPKEVWEELSEIRAKKKEYFVVFYLDVTNQVIKREIISIGTLNMSLAHPREVFEPAVKHVCAQILISHNHPSGDPMPSAEDTELTKRLIKAGEILGIEIIDHVIVTSKLYFSFKEHNLL
ncbi:MAG: repair protein RadC protein [Candidatus Roizmanbacteria bacterium GW2011_GWA2_36_23]|uniref:Repair protein RadC protein n=1 Tax=Candidatus Roizmanbacteria bacterium GW2011_GWA2_36_23 TaxID=1618480 RepID=A0A0G0E7Y9_9BACT|nr:MAG: repair protein RadC protein [Candidatus Roizmanbacteria bacterium GW2011_GWA2_36_23]